MKRTEQIVGILAGLMFLLAVVFHLLGQDWSSVLMGISVILILFIYLPFQLVRQRRLRLGKAERAYGTFKYISAFLVLLGLWTVMEDFAVGRLLIFLGVLCMAGLLFLYFYLGYKRRRKQPFETGDLVLSLVALGILLILTRFQVSPETVQGYQLIEEQYIKMNAGIEIANEMVYSSMVSAVETTDDALIEALIDLRKARVVVQGICEDSRASILDLNLHPDEHEKGSAKKLPSRFLANRTNGSFVMLEEQKGIALRKSIDDFRQVALGLKRDQTLMSNLIGMGLDTEVERKEDPKTGSISTWEEEMFDELSTGAVLVNLAWIQQMVLQTEANVLSGVINRVDLSTDARYLQEIAARESDRAMALKENELVRIRQGQELQNLQLQQSKAELGQQKTVMISAFFGIAFVMIMLFISTRAFYLKRRDNKRLAIQQKEIVAQNNVIQKSHGEISSSIEYAKRLQSSILPSPGLLKTRIRDHFVLFLPKHRVSGDFYWWTQIEDQVVITAADCTGHGVPGAFMSMLGVSMLREIVSKEYISHPGVILRRLRKEVMRALKQTGELGEQKDGMDMALVSINVETLECQYAGANNPLYLVRKGELTEYKADRMPISIHQQMDKFTTQDIQLKKGDHLYLFSDGYADQFGGPEDKKFKYKAFRQMLLEHSSESMSRQKQILEDTFNAWKGEKDQVDDIVVLGLEI